MDVNIEPIVGKEIVSCWFEGCKATAVAFFGDGKTPYCEKHLLHELVDYLRLLRLF